jgi:hypothetical protein
MMGLLLSLLCVLAGNISYEAVEEVALSVLHELTGVSVPSWQLGMLQ